MDYRITDAVTDPQPVADSWHSERLLRLPDSQWCFRPFGSLATPGPLPAREAGFVTFGSFNNISKVSDTALRCWAQILLKLPTSRLRLTRIRSPQRTAEILALFGGLGIAADRIDCIPYGSDAPYGLQFAGVDIALDPYPYNGVTTTCESLYFRLPVIFPCTGVTPAFHAAASKYSRTASDSVSWPHLRPSSTPTLRLRWRLICQDSNRCGLRCVPALNNRRCGMKSASQRILKRCYAPLGAGHEASIPARVIDRRSRERTDRIASVADAFRYLSTRWVNRREPIFGNVRKQRMFFSEEIVVPPLMTAVDIGAMLLEGDVDPYTRLNKLGRLNIIGFEPQPAECEKLNARALSGRRYLPYAVGDGTRRSFFVTNTGIQPRPCCGQILKFAQLFNNLAELMQVVATPLVDTVRLDDVAEIRIQGCDLLKLDTQGSEAEILAHASETLKYCLIVQTEVEFVPLYEDQPLFAEVDQCLRSHGFMFHRFLGHVRAYIQTAHAE